jgi:hypothetical protein
MLMFCKTRVESWLGDLWGRNCQHRDILAAASATIRVNFGESRRQAMNHLNVNKHDTLDILGGF